MTCYPICVKFGNKNISVFPQCDEICFRKPTVLRKWIDFCHCFRDWGTSAPRISYSSEEMTFFICEPSASSQSTTTFGASSNHLTTQWQFTNFSPGFFKNEVKPAHASGWSWSPSCSETSGREQGTRLCDFITINNDWKR